MAAPQIAPLPEFFELTGGMQIVVTAISATDGSTVSGVAISNAYADVEYVTDQATEPPAEVTFAPNYSHGDLAA